MHVKLNVLCFSNHDSLPSDSSHFSHRWSLHCLLLHIPVHNTSPLRLSTCTKTLINLSRLCTQNVCHYQVHKCITFLENIHQFINLPFFLMGVNIILKVHYRVLRCLGRVNWRKWLQIRDRK
jgi:hypothetical protein